MLGQMVAPVAQRVGRGDDLQALLVGVREEQRIAVDPVENPELHWRRPSAGPVSAPATTRLPRWLMSSSRYTLSGAIGRRPDRTQTSTGRHHTARGRWQRA